MSDWMYALGGNMSSEKLEVISAVMTKLEELSPEELAEMIDEAKVAELFKELKGEKKLQSVALFKLLLIGMLKMLMQKVNEPEVKG